MYTKFSMYTLVFTSYTSCKCVYAQLFDIVFNSQ